jgi:hypothetical protein
MGRRRKRLLGGLRREEKYFSYDESVAWSRVGVRRLIRGVRGRRGFRCDSRKICGQSRWGEKICVNGDEQRKQGVWEGSVLRAGNTYAGASGGGRISSGHLGPGLAGFHCHK